MNKYELALVIHPELSEEQRDQLLALIEKIIKLSKGTVDKRETGSKKLMAYSIKRQTEAWYYFITFSMPAEAMINLDAKLKVEEKLLRYLITKK